MSSSVHGIRLVRFCRLADGEKMLFAPEIHHAFRECRTCHQGFADGVGGEKLELPGRFDDEDEAIFAGQVDLSIGRHRGGAEAVGAVGDAVVEMLAVAAQVSPVLVMMVLTAVVVAGRG